MSCYNSLHNNIIHGGDLNNLENIKAVIDENPDEMYLNHYSEFNQCVLCKKDASRSESYFTYIYKCPVKTATIYFNVKLKMCYSCLCLGLHVYFLNTKSFPKLRNEGYIFHQNMLKLDPSLVENLKDKFSSGKYKIRYNIPTSYKCDYYSNFGNDFIDKLINDYELLI